MAAIQAFLRLDPDRAPEQEAFVRGRTGGQDGTIRILREAGGQFFVSMDDAQVATLLSQGIAVSVSANSGLLTVGAVSWRPATETPAVPDALKAATPSGADTGFWIVHFIAPADKTWLQDIALSGGEQLQRLDSAADVFRMTSVVADTVRALIHVDSVALFHPAYAVSLDLAGLQAPLSAEGCSALAPALPPDAPEGNLLLRVFDGLSSEDLRPALETAGATVIEPATQGFVLRVAPGTLEAVLAVPGIFTATVRAERHLSNHNAGVILGTNQVRDLGTVNFLVNLDGSGEIGAVVDSGFDVGSLLGAVPPPVGGVARPMTAFHPDLRASIRLLRDSMNPANAALAVPDNSPHGTHVAGTVAGAGNGSAQARGMAPRAALVGLGNLPPDIRPPFNFAVQQGARVINNSWGTTITTAAGVITNNNRYTTTESQPIDRWCYDNPETLVLFAAGNAEGDFNNDGVLDANTMDFEGAAKNSLTIGSCENLRNDGGDRNTWLARFGAGRYGHANFVPVATGSATGYTRSDNTDQVALNSCRGIVRDAGNNPTGRIKPDIVAPGVNILSCLSRWVAPPPALPAGLPASYAPAVYDPLGRSILPAGVSRTLYEIISGTSMATPMVSGCALLVRQFYRTRYAQLRRPLLLEGAVIPAAPAASPVFGGPPGIAVHVDGLVCVWQTPVLANSKKKIVAMRFCRHQTPLDATPALLQDDVGEHAAPKLVTVGERSYLLHRHHDGKMHLSCFDRMLKPVPGFGTAGVVTLAPDSRVDDAVPPDLIAADGQLACVWPAGVFDVLFQRFRADTGAAIDANPVHALAAAGTGPTRSLAWNGTRHAVCGVAQPGTFDLQVRQIDTDGKLVGTGAVTVLSQVKAIREPSLAWDPVAKRYALVWCDARNVDGGEIWFQLLDADAAKIGDAKLVVTVPAANHIRRPGLLPHPDGGFALFWEDDSQNAHFDLYFCFLDRDGVIPTGFPQAAGDPLNRRLVRVSDTPADTAGFSAFGDDAGFALCYQSPDEINSDRLGVYAVNLTRTGAFEAQEAAATPLLKSGHYVTGNLFDHDRPGLSALAATWTGASWYLLRARPDAGPLQRPQWQRLRADGAVDTDYGTAGTLERSLTFPIRHCSLLWNGKDRLISVFNELLTGITVQLFGALGAPVTTFGTDGAQLVVDSLPIHPLTPVQLGATPDPAFSVVVAYGAVDAGLLVLRQQRLDATGQRIGAAASLVTLTHVADGVARHDWFQYVPSEMRSIIIFHRVVTGATRVHCRRFKLDGTPDGAEQILSAATGEAVNGVLARRPDAVDSPNREYGAIWQYRAGNADPWSLRFSRLDRQGQPMANPPAPAPAMPVADIVVIDATSPGWNATRSAVEPQLVSTYTHEPWASPPALPMPPPPPPVLPEWSPSYGLAWIGVEAGGQRVLWFLALDENGRPLAVPAPPPPAGAFAAPVPLQPQAISTGSGSVQNFRLAWNGRVFLLNWVEEENGQVHHRYTVRNRQGNVIANDLPSAALLRATLVSGATNIVGSALPNTADGYGWGRVNLRQSLAPAPPVTLHVRDDCAVGPGRTVTYKFVLPAGTALLRVTLNWTDPPGPNLVNHLHLTVCGPGGPQPEYRGNLWSTVANQTHLSRPAANPPVAADAHEDIQTFKQVVLANPGAGEYIVEVSADVFPADPFNQQNLQAFALVFAGSGPEQRFAQSVAAVTRTGIY